MSVTEELAFEDSETIDRLKAELAAAREKLSEEKDAARYWQDTANEEAGSLESERLFHLKKIDDLKAELAAAREDKPTAAEYEAVCTANHSMEQEIAKLRALLAECFACYREDWMSEEQRKRFTAVGRGEGV